MSETTTDAPAPEETPAAAPTEETQAPAATDVPVPAVTAQEAKVVGDEAQPDPRPVEVSVTQEQQPAQVSQPREGDSDVVNVHEVTVTTDEVITDPSSPLAVQVPDAGRSPLLTNGLPISALSSGTVEDKFAEADKSNDE